MSEGCTPIEVIALLKLSDFDLVVRCLEVVRSHLPSILPVDLQLRVEVIALCHHHPTNIYPAFGVFGAESMKQVDGIDARIRAWVEKQGIDWLIVKSRDITVPTWAALKAKRNPDQ